MLHVTLALPQEQIDLRDFSMLYITL